MEQEIEKIKFHISSILDDLKEYLHPDDITEVNHYMNYNELKISVEMLCEFISESKFIVSKNVSDKIKIVSKKLNIDERYWVDFP